MGPDRALRLHGLSVLPGVLSLGQGVPFPDQRMSLAYDIGGMPELLNPFLADCLFSKGMPFGTVTVYRASRIKHPKEKVIPHV